jgi:DNA polymerase III subunit delta
MKLTLQQLPLHLKKPLLPVYLITGDEYLLVQEARDLILAQIRQTGAVELLRHDANKDFDYQHLIDQTSSLSLFSDKTLIEIKLHHKPNANAAKLLAELIRQCHADKMLLLSCDKLDSNAQKSDWYTATDKHGAIITIWPLAVAHYRKWLAQRLRQNNLRCEPAVIDFLLNQSEGNLLSLAQEVAKLQLIFGNHPITLNDMMAMLVDNAKYDIFNFIDTILAGDPKAVQRVLYKLRAEAVEPTLLLWAITREIRSLLYILIDLQGKMSWEAVLKKHKVWDKRKNLIKKSVTRLTVASLHQMLLQAQTIDYTIKGLRAGNIWDELTALAYALLPALPCNPDVTK